MEVEEVEVEPSLLHLQADVHSDNRAALREEEIDVIRQSISNKKVFTLSYQMFQCVAACCVFYLQILSERGQRQCQLTSVKTLNYKLQRMKNEM